MKNTLYLLFLFVLLLSCNISEKKASKKEINISASFLPDSNYLISHLKTKPFKPFYNNKISYKNGMYWFKIILKDKIENNKDLIFQIEEPSIESLEIYNHDKLIASSKSIKGNSLLTLRIKKSNNSIYYLKAYFKRQVHFPIHIYTIAQFHKAEKKKNLGFGLYYGMTIMVFIINFIFYISLKDNTFLWYCLFLASINLAFTGFDGILYLYFDQQVFDVFLIFCHFLIQVFGMKFASKFLGIKDFYPKSNSIGYISLTISAGFYLLFFITDNFFLYAIADLLGLLILAYYWILGLLMIKKEEYAKFFVIGYSMILFFGIFYLIPLNFGISFFNITFNQLKLGALFEMLVLTYAVTYRVKKLQEENNTYRKELQFYIEEIYGLKERLKNVNTIEKEKSLNSKIEEIKHTYHLTDREVDILLKITEGFSNALIAEKLFISINTVKYHTKNLYEKLDVKKRTEISSKIIFNK